MDKATLGKRIKEARLAKKMTQAEVVGSFITRNMLSQIESGTATPSVKTLEYLSNVLEVPLAYLMPNQTEDNEGDSYAELVEIKGLYKSGNYTDAANFNAVSDMFEDEICAIKAKSLLELAKAGLSQKDPAVLQQAVDHAKSAAELSSQGIYSNSSVKTEAVLTLSELAHKLADYYKEMAADENKTILT